MFLQSYVVPCCTFSIDVDGANVKTIEGSAFFINSKGVLLTAKHVLQDGIENAEKKNLNLGFVVKGESGKNPKNYLVKILNYEYAPEPYDIAICKVEYSCETLLTLEKIEIDVWKDVATFGYPVNAVSGNPEKKNINIRCHKGYIQRIINPGDLHIRKNPNCFETNFLIDKGLSGAPLFVHKEPKDIVIGVCTGSERTSLIEDEYEEVDENGKKYIYTKVKIEEYGVADDLRYLHDWKPNLLDGATLLESATI